MTPERHAATPTAAEWGASVPAANMGLASAIHERVVPRLCGVALALGADGSLDPDSRRRCHTELVAAMRALRSIVLDAQGRDERPAAVADAGDEFGRGDSRRRVAHQDRACLDPDLQALVAEVVAEGTRNALRHGAPSVVRVDVSVGSERLAVSISSDGASHCSRGAGLGIGLALAARKTAQGGGRLEWGPEGGDEWLLRLTMPLKTS